MNSVCFFTTEITKNYTRETRAVVNLGVHFLCDLCVEFSIKLTDIGYITH